MDEILSIQGLVVRFYTYEGVVKAIEGVDLFLKEGETLGIVGETGCGKSVTTLSAMVLTPPPGRIEGGKVLLKTDDGYVNLFELDKERLRKVRSEYMAIVFQEPGSALNPVYTIGDQIAEGLIVHKKEEYCRRALEGLRKELEDGSSAKAPFLRFEAKVLERMLKGDGSRLVGVLSRIPVLNRFNKRIYNEAMKDAINLLREMGIPDPERVVKMYPHELSGGMKQRVVIAMALTGNPKILIADEPTTSLDVTVQAQVLELIKRTKDLTSSSVIYITHDMGVIAEMCDRVAVMYAGTVCEVADVYELFKNPMHPYTKALIESIPRPGAELKSIPGMVPNLIEPPPGCRFHPRCPYAKEICKEKRPPLKEVKPGHFVACHLYGGEYGTPDKGIRP